MRSATCDRPLVFGFWNCAHAKRRVPATRSASPLRLEGIRPAYTHPMLSKTNLASALLCAATSESAAFPEAALTISQDWLLYLLLPVMLDVDSTCQPGRTIVHDRAEEPAVERRSQLEAEARRFAPCENSGLVVPSKKNSPSSAEKYGGGALSEVRQFPSCATEPADHVKNIKA